MFKVMNKSFMLILFICILFAFANAKTYIIVDDELKNCAKADEDMKLYDFSNFKFIAYNDTHTFMNGTIIANKEIKSPWIVNAHSEHYERGHWLMQGITNYMPDFCKEFHNPVKPWYYVTKRFKACPIPAGYKFIYDMVPIKFPEHLLNLVPNHYMGHWRMINVATFNESGKTLYQCLMASGDVFVE